MQEGWWVGVDVVGLGVLQLAGWVGGRLPGNDDALGAGRRIDRYGVNESVVDFRMGGNTEVARSSGRYRTTVRQR